ncbi:galactose-specific lectin nattectin-like [Larimichthys crocea]|uniref:galactose-specific lectin nattectin-like n=1 Tax=Larimichthys crocea TaxID=215358 RepID=UPI000F5F8E5F|nr:galactose-specific lectin nattectin-like [Larimichthys crocea]
MNFTMKILAVSVLLVAMMALALATEAPPEAEAAAVTEAPVQEDEAADDSSNKETESEDEEGEEAESTEGEKKHYVAKRSTCPGGWRLEKKIYYRYFGYSKTWAEAEAYCRALGGTLASVHNSHENHMILVVAGTKDAWIGFSDAQQERYWFWSDGTRFDYRNWCGAQPDNAGKKEHCALYRGNCWHDVPCSSRLPFVCTRR